MYAIIFSMNKSAQKFHKGFTLLETLFSILIFSAALISLMTIAARGISATADSEQTTTASYLAQEGIEVARNIRDSNYASGAAFDATLSTCTAAAPCNISYGSTPTAMPILAVTTCGGIQPGTTQANPICSIPVYQSSVSGWYTNLGQGATQTQFYRTIYVIPNSAHEDQIISRVNWTYKTIPQTVSLDTIVTNWQ